ncbi:MAG: tape measure protein [Eikenella sp.]|nr:tape measure protein [Eikenella sp.]
MVVSDLEAKIRVTAENAASAGLSKVESDIQKLERTAQKTGQTLDAVKAKYEQQVQAALKAGASVDSLAGSFLGADGKLRAADGRLVKISEGMGKVSDSAKKAAAEVENASARMNSALEKVNAVFGKIGTMLAGVGLTIGAGALLQTADAMAVLNNQVRQATANEAEYAAVKKDLLNISNRTKAEIEATTDLYVKSSRALKDYGYSQQQILTFTEATANAMTIGGVGAQQQAAALMQLSQALGSGVLQGDEFKSIAEAAPILLDTIAEYMGKSRAEIKKLGSEGKLTAEVVFEAISGASEKFAEQAAKMPLTFGQSLTILSNNWKSFVNGMMNDTGVMSVIANAVKMLADNLHIVVPAVAAVAAGFAATFVPAIAAATANMIAFNVALLANPIGLLVTAVVGAIALIATFGDEVDVLGDGFTNLHDVIRAAWELITETISAAVDTVGSVVDEIQERFSGVTDFLGNVVDKWLSLFESYRNFVLGIISGVVNAIIGYFVTCYQNVTAAWNNAPQFFSNLGNSIANIFLSAIEWMVNRAIDKINGLIGLANQAISFFGGSGLDPIKHVSFERRNDGGYGEQVKNNLTRDYVGEAAAAVRTRAQANKLNDAARAAVAQAQSGRGDGGRSAPAAGGGGGRGSRGGGRQEDPVAKWAAELAADKLAYQEKELLQGTHEKWSLARELEFWQAKLKLVDANSKAGLDIRRRILDLQNKLYDEQARAAEQRITAEANAAKHQIALAEQQADQMLATERITQSQRLEMDLTFEQQRFEIARNALQERLTLAEQDPERSPEKLAQLHEQMLELERQYQLKRNQIINGKENQDRKDNPSFMEALQDGKQNVWQHAQEQMSQAFTAMLNRTQSFRQAMGNMFRSIGQNFIQEVVTKPLMAQLRGALQQTAIWKMLFGTKSTMETAAVGETITKKAIETATVVKLEAKKAAAGGAASQAGIPYVGPMLAVAAMGTMMAAVMGLIGGGGGGSTSTTTTRIPSAAGGWDIPAGINPLTQLHEREMVLPAEHADTIRSMAGNGGGGGETIVINATGGDWIHKRDLAKLLRAMKRDFRFA